MINIVSIVFAVVEILLAGYLFYAAITGKSRTFSSANIKKGKQAVYKKIGRIGFAAIGVPVLLLGILNLIASILAIEGGNEALLGKLGTISDVLMWLSLTGLIVLYVLTTRLQERKKKSAPAQHTAPRAAFFFDEEEAPPETQRKGKGK